MFMMKQQLEKYAELPTDSNKYFVPLREGSPLAT
jgi:hypothetical protein